MKNPKGTIKILETLFGENHSSWWSSINIIESCMNKTYHETIDFTSIGLHLNKKLKWACTNWLNFPPNGTEINYERKLEIAKDISREGKNRATKFNEAHHLTSIRINNGQSENQYILFRNKNNYKNIKI